MGKASHAQPLFQFPVPQVLVLPEGRSLHCCSRSLYRSVGIIFESRDRNTADPVSLLSDCAVWIIT